MPVVPRRLVLVTALLALVAATLASCAGQPAPNPPAAARDTRPNIVVIMTDDQTLADMAFLPKTTALLGAGGTTFTNFFATFPLCCPSRATFLTGQFAHNHGVRNNVPPDGGNDKLDHSNTLPVWLKAAGYSTAHVGKYLNGYGERTRAVVPPGYDDWFGLIDPSTLHFWDYEALDNGEVVHFGDADDDYQTDVLARRATADIERFAKGDSPFYLSIWTLAPHSGLGKGVPEFVSDGATIANPVAPAPAPRHDGRYRELTFPRGPSFLEPDTSDKSEALQKIREQLLNGLETAGLNTRDVERLIDQTYRARAESLLAVDDLVEQTVQTLERTGELDDTVIVFTSDNGWLLGEHGLPFAKVVLYEESAHVPLLVRGPGFPAGTTVDQPTANVDLAPTLTALAQAKAGLVADGRNLAPLVTKPDDARYRAILLEEYSHKPTQLGVRVAGYSYIEWGDESVELYDLTADRLQLDSRAADPAFAGRRARLKATLDRLRDCKGAACLVVVPPAELQG